MKLYYLYIFCAFALILAIFNLPGYYYKILRILISIGAIGAIWELAKLKITYLILIFSLITVLFNPFIPIYLYKKLIWIPIDIITALLFLVLCFLPLEKKEKTKSSPDDSASQPIFQRDKISTK